MLLLIIGTVALFVCQCTPGLEASGGGGTETGNGVSVASIDNTLRIEATPGVVAQLLAATYDPYRSIGYRDSLHLPPDGNWIADTIPVGTYNIFFRTPDGDSVCLLAGIPLGPNVTYYDSSVLRAGCTVDGTIGIEDTIPCDSIFCFMIGSPFADTVNHQGKFGFPSVPPSDYVLTAVVYQTVPCTGPRCNHGTTQQDSIAVSLDVTVPEVRTVTLDKIHIPPR